MKPTQSYRSQSAKDASDATAGKWSPKRGSVEGDGRSALKITKPFGVAVKLMPENAHDGNNAAQVRRDSDARHPLTQQYTNRSMDIRLDSDSAHLDADDLK